MPSPTETTTSPDEADEHELLQRFAEARNELKRTRARSPEELKYHIVETLYEALGALVTQVVENDERIADLEEDDSAEGLTQDTADVIHTFVGSALEVLMELTDVAEVHRPDLMPRIVEVTEMAAPLTEMIEGLIMEEDDEDFEEDDWSQGDTRVAGTEAEPEEACKADDALEPAERAPSEPSSAPNGSALRPTREVSDMKSQGDDQVVATESQRDSMVAGTEAEPAAQDPEDPSPNEGEGNLDAGTEAEADGPASPEATQEPPLAEDSPEEERADG